MKLESMYNNIKNTNRFLEIVFATAIMAGGLFVLTFVWNFVAPVWGLPVLSFLQFCASVLLVNIIFAVTSIYFLPAQEPERHLFDTIEGPTLDDFMEEE